MPGPPPFMPLPPSFLELLPQWVARQRWYAGKGRVPVLRRVGGLSLEDPAGEVGIAVHLILDESGETPTVYQVPLTCRSARLAGADHALVATVDAHRSLLECTRPRHGAGSQQDEWNTGQDQAEGWQAPRSWSHQTVPTWENTAR